MKVRLEIVFLLLLCLAATAAWLRGESEVERFAQPSKGSSTWSADRPERSERAERFEAQRWDKTTASGLMEKRFRIETWKKHFSGLGSKRAPIEVDDDFDGKRIEVEIKEFPLKEKELSAWSQRLARLEREARIGTDDRARQIANEQLYGALFQDTSRFADMGEELSLREINRYQFRRNRSSDSIPVQRAGDPR